MSDINNPQVFLKMNSVTNGLSPDISGNQHNATAQSVAITEDDTFGNCSLFDGYNSVLHLDNINYTVFRNSSGNNQYGNICFSITMWFKPNAIQPISRGYYPNNVIFSITNPQGSDLFAVGFSEQANLQFLLNVELQSNNTSPIPSDIPVSLNEWHFLALVVNNNAGFLQLDSTVSNFSFGSNLADNEYVTLWLGRSFGTYEMSQDAVGMAGTMANMRAYNSALDSNDLATIQAADLSSPAMQIFLPMNEASGDSTPDYTVYNYPAILCGNPVLTPDIQFGTVMDFNGTDQYIAINNFSYLPSVPIYALTVQAWIKVDPSSTGNMIIASFDRNYYWELSLVSDGSSNLLVNWITVDRNGISDTLTGTIKMNDGLWHYVTVSYASGNGIKTIYDNGQEDTVRTNAHFGLALGKSSGLTRYGFIAAGSNTSSFNTSGMTSPTFSGEMCQFRLYNSELSSAAITRNMYAGRTSAASYTLGYPLWFGLKEENEQNVIYIYDEPSGHSVTCSVMNTSDMALTIPAGGTPTADNYQFAIFFRPGTLSQEAITNMQLQETNWTMSAPTLGAGGSVALYFTSVAGMTMLPMSVITLTLLNVSASAAGGTRNSRISFIYNRISYYGSSSPISGNSEISVDIINREGSKDVPISFAFQGRNEIYCGPESESSDGYTFSLLITCTRNGTGGLIINGKNEEAPTRFRISFETGTDSSSSLILNTNHIIFGASASVDNSINGGGVWSLPDTPESSDDTMPYWLFSPNNTFTFLPGDAIKITFTNVIPSNITGNINVYLDWEDLPGYWDGRTTIQLQKTHIITDDTGKIGYQVQDPDLPLTLKTKGYGISNNNNSIDFYTNQHPRLSLDSYGNLVLNGTPSNALSFTNSYGNIKTTGVFAVDNNTQNGLQFQNSGTSTVLLGIDSANNFSIQSKSGNSFNSRLSISSAGSVGIGTASQSSITLSVNGSAAASKTASGGIVNIGTPNMQYLQIDGSNIISKNTNAQTGTLNLTGSTVVMSGAVTANDGLTIKHSNATKLTVNNSGITFSPNIPVFGIPIVKWITVQIDIGSGTSSNGRGGTTSVSFDSTVKSAVCAIQSWKLRYKDDNDHEFKMGWVNTSCSFSSNQVNVTVSIMLTDATGDDGDDAYEGSVTVLVIASLANSVSSS